uniref:PLC-beta PH domain-containing protein n=1 Tax=Anguilla anguilla TaxID=7936 RepID=A0A0E9UJT3_ANGAN
MLSCLNVSCLNFPISQSHLLLQETESLDITYIKDARAGKSTKTPKVRTAMSCSLLLTSV